MKIAKTSENCEKSKAKGIFASFLFFTDLDAFLFFLCFGLAPLTLTAVKIPVAWKVSVPVSWYTKTIMIYRNSQSS